MDATYAEPRFEPDAWLEQHPLAHWLFDIGTLRLLWANAAALARYGHTAEAFARLTRDDLLMPEEVPRAHAFMAALPRSLLQQPVWRERTADGRELTADWRGITVRWQGRRARLVTVIDAGRREQLALDQQRSRELQQVAGRMALIGGWTLDLRAGVVVWSDEVCALHEVPPGTRASLAEAVRFYPAEHHARLQEQLRRCIEQGEPLDFEMPFVGAKGTQRWVRVVGEAVRDAGGAVVGVQGAQQDVTATHAATRALAASRAKLAALIAAIPDLWMVYDAHFRYLDVSDPAHPGLSAPWSEKLGRPLRDTVAAELADEVMRLSAQAHSSGQPQSHHYALAVSDGRTRWFEARYVAMDEGCTLALIRDVTETRELGQRFRDLAEAAPMGIFMADDSGAVTYTNPAWRALTQLDAEAAKGTGWAQAVLPEDVAAVARGWYAYVAHSTVYQTEFRIRATAGTPERTVWAQARPMPQAAGAPAGSRLHVGCVVDVTPARQLQREREARAVAEEAGRRQTAFLSRVSHELRTPLNAILGFGELLRPELAAEGRQAAYLGHMVEAGRHMLALVDDLLELQRIEQGRFEPSIERLQALPLLQSVAQMLAPLAQAAAMAVHVEADDTLVLASDERALRQILLNLAGNAIKYGRPGGGLWLRAALAGPERCVLSVHDDGPGMDDEQLQRLFTPFERLGHEQGSVGGSGLGLVISRQLAQALGGALSLRSVVGQGTTAELSLPLGV